MTQCFSQGDWQAYLDREMPAGEMARAQAHIEQCRECAALHQEVAGRAERVALLMTELASPDGFSRQPSPRPQAWRWAVPAVSLAATLAAALLVVWLSPSLSVQPAVARIATAPRTEAPATLLAGFIALDDEPIETAIIVRVTLDDGLARADVMVGPDGRAHAIRMVPGRMVPGNSAE